MRLKKKILALHSLKTRMYLLFQPWRKDVLPLIGTGIPKCSFVTKANAEQETACARYGGRNTVTLMTGDGVWPELLNHVQEIYR